MKQFEWQVVGCSMPAIQRRERHGHQKLIAALCRLPTMQVVFFSARRVDFMGKQLTHKTTCNLDNDDHVDNLQPFLGLVVKL